MHQSTFCIRCNQRIRSPSHVCQPSAIKKFQRIKQAMKRSAERGASR